MVKGFGSLRRPNFLSLGLIVIKVVGSGSIGKKDELFEFKQMLGTCIKHCDLNKYNYGVNR